MSTRAAIDVPARCVISARPLRHDMVGKDPHRLQGKTKDMEHMASARTGGKPYTSPSQKEIAEADDVERQRRGGPTRLPAEEAIGGSRPGVPRRRRPED